VGSFLHDLGVEMLDEVAKEAPGESFGVRARRAATRASKELSHKLTTPKGQAEVRSFVKSAWQTFLNLSRS
jgi:hypothetical protein